jgi:hypothetical protein
MNRRGKYAVPPLIVQPIGQEDPLLIRCAHPPDSGRWWPFHFVTDHPDYFETNWRWSEQSGLFQIATSSTFEGGDMDQRLGRKMALSHGASNAVSLFN